MASASRPSAGASRLRSAPAALVSCTPEIALIGADFLENAPAPLAQALAAAAQAGAEPRFAHVQRRLAATTLTFATAAAGADAAAAAVFDATGAVVSVATGFALVTVAAETLGPAADLETLVYKALAVLEARIEAVDRSNHAWSALAPAEEAPALLCALEAAISFHSGDDTRPTAAIEARPTCPQLSGFSPLGDRRQNSPESDPARCM